MCTVLSGHELQRARDLLHSIDADDGEAEMGSSSSRKPKTTSDVDEKEEELREAAPQDDGESGGFPC